MTDNDATDVALRDTTAIDAEIQKLTALAHTGRPADERIYEASQPRLRELIAAKSRGVAARNPGTGQYTAQQQQRAVTEGAPSSIGAYAELPSNSDQFDGIDRQVWIEVLPDFQKLGLSTTQVSGLSKLLEAQSRKAQELRADVERDKQAESRSAAERVLRARFGERWDQRRIEAERTLKIAMRNDPRAKIGTWQLANGEQLGNRPEFISMLIELAEMQR